MKRSVAVISVMCSVLMCLAIVGGVVFAFTSPQMAVEQFNPPSNSGVPQQNGEIKEPVPLIENIDSVDPQDIADAYKVVSDSVDSVDLSGAQGFDAQTLHAMAKMRRVNEQSLGALPEAESADSGTGLSDTQNVSARSSSNAETNDVSIVDAIEIEGQIIPFTDSYLTSSAPAQSAGLWNGSASTTDGSWAYFIGHNPGLFSCILDLGMGSPVTVYDDAGNSRTYHVIDEFDVPNSTTWSGVESAVTSHGESVALQTCIDGGLNYHIIIAA